MNLYNADCVAKLLAYDLISNKYLGSCGWGTNPHPSSLCELYENKNSNGYLDMVYERGPKANELTLEIANFYLGFYTKEYIISDILDFVFLECKEPYVRLVLNHAKKQMPDGINEVTGEEMTEIWHESQDNNKKIQTPTSIVPLLDSGNISIDSLIKTLQKIKEELPNSDKAVVRLRLDASQESGGLDINNRLVVLPTARSDYENPETDKKNKNKKNKNKKNKNEKVEQKVVKIPEPQIIVIQGVTGYYSTQQY